MSKAPTAETLAAYWKSGEAVIEACLAKALKADHADAPFPFDEQQAALWHQAQAAAYQHALEMMGYPEHGSDEALRRTTERTVAVVAKQAAN